MGRLVLTNARLLDGDNAPQDAMTIVVNGDRFESVGRGEYTNSEGDADVYDLGGRTVMPGMVHGHYHATYTRFSAAEKLPVGMEAPPALQTLRAANHLREALYAGFTGVVSAGAPYAIDAACKIAIAQGLMEGPRIVAGSRDVSTTGHSQDGFEWHWGQGMTSQTNIADGVDSFRRAVREEMKRGAEMIKIFATPGHGVVGFYKDLEMSVEELQAAIETAHSRDCRIRAHIANKRGIMESVRLGIDIVDHGDGIDQECIDLMLEKDVFLVPSIRYPYEACKIWSGDLIDEMRRGMEHMIEWLPIANKAGLKMTLGDDYGAQPLDHGTYGEELEFYVRVAGISPLDVIRWATKFGGEMVTGNKEDLGTIAKGKLADFIVVDGDPIANIGILGNRSNFLAVAKGGTLYGSRLGAHLRKPAGSKPARQPALAK
jgi:imidazolonepropionase-like amidohydrolase